MLPQGGSGDDDVADDDDVANDDPNDDDDDDANDDGDDDDDDGDDANTNFSLMQRCAAWAWPLSLGAELFLMLAQVHSLCNAVLINAHIGSIGRICA